MNDRDTADSTPIAGQRTVLYGSTLTAEEALAHSTQQSGRKSIPRHILLVEDDATLGTLEAEILRAYGYTTVTVESGELAIAALDHVIPDLVVLDLELTGPISGWDVLHRLRSTAAIPVLITSSSATAVRTYLRSCEETRFTLDHLPKPYPLQTLLKRIKRMLPINLY